MKYFSLFFALAFLIQPVCADDKVDPSLTVHLLDYLAKDYGGAVQDGKVVSEFEYKEQIEFADLILTNSEKIKALAENVDFSKKVKLLNSKIKTKADAVEVAKIARELQASAIQLAKIQVMPQSYPLISEGEKLYRTSCTLCHGATGLGDGPGGKGLDPAPANFLDHDGKLASSPYQFFNTIRLGVPGTGMPSFSHLTDKEVWELAFYVKSLGFAKTTSREVPALQLAEISSLKDGEVLAKVSGSEDQKKTTLAHIRTFEPVEDALGSPLALARGSLEQSFSEATRGNFEGAKNLSLKAYLEGVEPIEPKIRANRSGLVEKIESHMISYRSALADGDVELAKSIYVSLDGLLLETEQILKSEVMSPKVALSASFAILLREGFEAVLIVITLLSAIKAFNIVGAAFWVHLGWGLALGLGVIAWIFSGILIGLSGATREITEGVVSLFAVLVLLYVGFWMHRQTEIHRWTKFVKESVHAALERKKLLLLTGISFMAVFREAIEVVLFLRAIWSDVTAEGQLYVLGGIVSAFVVVFGLSVYMLKFSQRLPIKKLFSVSSAIMSALAVILTGKGVHSLQEAGTVSATSLPVDLRIELLGVYPSYEVILAQLAIVFFLVFLWFIGSRASEGMLEVAQPTN